VLDGRWDRIKQRKEREERERSERWRAAIPRGKGVMLLGFPRIGNSWIGKHSPAALHVDAGQTANIVVAQLPASK
jgi:hypothetical protein